MIWLVRSEKVASILALVLVCGRDELVGQLAPILDAFNAADICDLVTCADEVDHEVKFGLDLLYTVEPEKLFLQFQGDSPGGGLLADLLSLHVFKLVEMATEPSV